MITRGGAEIAAYALYQELRKIPTCEAWFLGCRPHNGNERLGAAITQPFDSHEFIYSTGQFDWLKHANRDPNFPNDFRDLIKELRPDVIHFHHFINFGIEVFAIARQVMPKIRIVLTIHEYLAICHHYGQMVKRPRETLCHSATLDSCNRCFPNISQSDFFLRNLYIKTFLEHVDAFISPSQFLANRFIEWGIAPDRLLVVENIIAEVKGEPLPVRTSTGPLRIGFFGQISRLKGIKVLMDTAELLWQDQTSVVFHIYGDYSGQPPDMQKEFLEHLEKAGPSVVYHGRYDPEQVDALIHGVDCTIVPSIWWENSPVVIQEALRNRRPVICSNIGGMSEKIRDGIDGWHFQVGSATALADLLRRLASDRGILEKVSSTTNRPPSRERIVQEHLSIFSSDLTP